MLASKLITKLSKAIEKYGDFRVTMQDGDDAELYTFLSSVYVCGTRTEDQPFLVLEPHRSKGVTLTTDGLAMTKM